MVITEDKGKEEHKRLKKEIRASFWKRVKEMCVIEVAIIILGIFVIASMLGVLRGTIMAQRDETKLEIQGDIEDYNLIEVED